MSADPSDWEALAADLRRCTACPELVAARTQVVVGEPGAASDRAGLVILGEAPGATEDNVGRPFVGASGRLLDQLLDAAGLDRAGLAVLNTVKCRPPGNRPPRPAETARCRPWTSRQLDLLAPALVVALGGSATRWFLGPGPLGPVRGQVHQVTGPTGRTLNVLPTYHPAAALRGGPAGSPRRLLAADLRLAASWTSSTGADRVPAVRG